MRVVIIGAGGQGTIVAEILQHRAGVDLIGFLDDDQALDATLVLGVPVIGPVSRLDGIGHDAVIVAIGDNARRARLSEELQERGERLLAVVHPRASLAPGVEPGPGSMVSAGVVVVPGVRLGRGVLLNTRCSIDHHSEIGDFAHIGPGATLGANVTIGARTLVGLGASIMSGRCVGADAVVGAAALVTRNVPARVVVTGAPARVVRPHRPR